MTDPVPDRSVPSGPEPPAPAAPGEAARALWLAAVARGGRLPAEPLSGPEGAALDALLDLGLLVPHPCGPGYLAVSPRAVAARLGAELRTEATRLLLAAERLPAALDGLTRAYDAVPRRGKGPQGRSVQIEGREDIRQRIAELLSDCREEFLAAQPGPRPAVGLQMTMRQDLALLQRGCAMRTIYQPVAARGREAVRYAATMTGHGARVRVLDEPYRRMLVFDRTIAVIPADDADTRAAFVTDPAAVAHLVGLFERDWARADTVDWAAVAAPPEPGAGPDRVARLLAKGLTQRAVAGRLGLSERTVAAHIARLRHRHGARTLFQLGWRMRGEHRDAH
ncbi:LuxR C-terminal-related transcriptional regulator [Kitasatospora sp. NPDC054939]